MDRRRAAGALLALAACIASSTAAPTATNHTALDLYDEPTEGCYYNFQHYGEGDRIMTNEPCLNCTCHNRMLMCYLRVCPFTKAIGQDCTVEKRADQCCPIVTCPDVPVDLLTSTSTSSPAEYGGTSVGKVDKYGCSINGKYFPEGAKVPPTPGKPCEHCYCIRNMTTCVMQECTLHVDGCTPIYHKDVCCPVRYFCDHPEDEIPLLDDMTTTVRPTQGFLLTTTAPTEAPTTTISPARRDCIEDDQLYTDGALIKTEKPCEHCYCMKGDIVCVVQECGTPMENEGKNCTSLPPREGQCCPDTYICEGDNELSTEPTVTEMPLEELTTTISPPRRVSVEGSGYRNEDEISYTEAPTLPTELEGSGEEELSEKPEIYTTDKLTDKYGPTEEAEFIPLTTQAAVIEGFEKATTEPDKGVNTVPSGGMEEEHIDFSVQKTTLSDVIINTEPTHVMHEGVTLPSIASKEEETSKPTISEQTTPIYEMKSTEPSILEEQSTLRDDSEKATSKPSDQEKEEEKITTQSVVHGTETHIPLKTDDLTTEPAASLSTEPLEHTDLPLVINQDMVTKVQETPEATTAPSILSDEKTTVLPSVKDEESVSTVMDARRTPPNIQYPTTPMYNEENTEITTHSTPKDKLDVTEPALNEQNTVPVSSEEEQSSGPPMPEMTTTSDELKSTEESSIVEKETTYYKEETSETSALEKTTAKSDIEASVAPAQHSTNVVSEDEEQAITTEPTFRKEDEVTPVEIVTQKELELSTISTSDYAKETEKPFEMASTDIPSAAQSEQPALESTTLKLPEQYHEEETTSIKETTTETMMELSTFAHVNEKDSTTVAVESGTVHTSVATDKIDISETTTINPADNEIAEVPSPGRIPGEGDCLLEGTTYKNDSIVPSTNKCHSGCKCVSSIIKCDPIICSPAPEDMDNCQPRYDTPESCCPTYVCDHGMETIPPQPQSHITGTESPTPSTVECHDDECEKVEDNQQVSTSTQPPEKLVPSDCGSGICDQTLQTPEQHCTDGKCEIPLPTIEQQQPHEIPQPCTNPEDCKEIKLPKPVIPCDGESCMVSQDEICNEQGDCTIKPQTKPTLVTPQMCESEEECKQVKITQPDAACEDASCKKVQEDCKSGECKVGSSPPQPSKESEICSEESGCKKTGEDSKCENGKCDHKQVDDRTGIVCKEDSCIQQQPILPSKETTLSESMSTKSPVSEEATPVTELPTAMHEETATIESTVSGEPEKEINEQQPAVSDKQEQVTDVPEQDITRISEMTTFKYVAEPETSQGESTTLSVPVSATPQEHTTLPVEVSESVSSEVGITSPSPTGLTVDVEAKPTETVSPEEVTELNYDKLGKPIEEETEKTTELAIQTESSLTDKEKTTKSSEIEGFEQERTESSIIESDSETKKPFEELETITIQPQAPETVTEKEFVVTTKAAESIEETSEDETKESEPSVQDTQDIVTEKPVILHETGTKSPAIEEHITTEIVDNLQTELPTVITPLQESVTEEKKQEENESTTPVPERSGIDEQSITTVSSEETHTESGVKETPTQTTDQPSDKLSTEYEIKKDDIPELHVTESQTASSPVQTEIITEAQQAETEVPEIIDVTSLDEKVTTPGSKISEDDKQTESPLSLVTKYIEADITTVALPITGSDERVTNAPEVISTKPHDYTQQEEIKTETPESYEPQKTATQPSLTDFDKTESSQEETTDITKKPEPEISTEKLEPTKANATVESAEPGTPSTKIPTILGTESPIYEEKATESPHETELPQVHDEIISKPIQPPSLAKVEDVTKSQEPSITEEQELYTEEPVKSEEVEHQTIVIPTNPPIDVQDMLTQEPELIIPQKPYNGEPTESSVDEEKKNTTEKPVADVEIHDITEKEHIQTIVPETVTEISDHISGEKGTSEVEQDVTETPGEFITQQLITESPELHEMSVQPETEEKEHEIESPKLSTESPLEETLLTKIPESTVKEEEPVTVPVSPVKEAQTELPVAQEEATTIQPDFVEPEISEFTTISSIIQETEQDKQTKQPSLATEPQEITTTSPQQKETFVPEQDVSEKQDQEPPKSVQQDELPNTTETTMEINTGISEDDKLQPPEDLLPSPKPEIEHSETTPYLVELEEHTHKLDEEEPTVVPSEEPSVITPQEPTKTTSAESTILPSEEPIVIPSKEHTTVPKEETTTAPKEEPSVAASEGPLQGPQEPTVSTTEKSTVYSLEESTAFTTRETAIITSEQPMLASTEEPVTGLPEVPTTTRAEIEPHPTEGFTEELSEDKHTEQPEAETERPSNQKEESPLVTEGSQSLTTLEETSEKLTEPTIVDITTAKPTDVLVDKYGVSEEKDKEKETTTPKLTAEEEPPASVETEKPIPAEELDKDAVKPQNVPVETTAPEEEFIPVTAKATTSKPEEESLTQIPEAKPDEKPSETPQSTATPEISKPDELQPTDDIPSPEDESHFPPSGGYNQEPDYVEEDQAFGPGTCRYGGKVYVSAQQIPRDDPCDFCFCFRSDIICLQQSCPPPIHGCHEEPIQGFCCPRYECPVSMATTLNVTTTTTTTTTTLPPHFLPHAYKGAAQRKGCQIKGHTYQVGEVVRASSGPCLHCTCGGDGQMKCDPKQCTPEPMLRQMIAAAVSVKRRR